MSDDFEFQEFCDDLERLKGQSSLHQAPPGLTQKILSVIQRGQKKHVRRQFMGIATSMVIGMMFGLVVFSPRPGETAGGRSGRLRQRSTKYPA